MACPQIHYTGGTIQISGASVLAVSRRQDAVADSTTRAELMAASTLCGDIEYVADLARSIGFQSSGGPVDLHVTHLEPVTVHVDSQPCID